MVRACLLSILEGHDGFFGVDDRESSIPTLGAGLFWLPVVSLLLGVDIQVLNVDVEFVLRSGVDTVEKSREYVPDTILTKVFVGCDRESCQSCMSSAQRLQLLPAAAPSRVLLRAEVGTGSV